MEWVEITGKTVEEATERALEQLGVDKSDADIEVVAEPKTGLFGRVRGEARVRARVRPTSPRPKRSRGGRSRGRDGKGNGNGDRRSGGGQGNQRSKDRGEESQDAARHEGDARHGKSQRSNKPKAAGAAAAATMAPAGGATKEPKEDVMAEGVTLEEQAAVGKEFLEGLISTMELTASVEIRPIDDETVELAVDGEGLGMLVGPRGTTLAALQDITRTVVQGRYPTKTDRILVDVARYRERRAEALTRFTQQVAAEVIAEGAERSLEPMSPADRKVVHDAVNNIEGVTTRSEGEDARRHIVISLSNG
jgi:spoIIIJ-associated protein